MSEDLSPGQEKGQQLKALGLTDEEVGQWADEKRQSLTDLGLKPQEINEYFGIKPPDLKQMQDFVSSLVETAPIPKQNSSSYVTSTLPGDVPAVETSQDGEQRAAEGIIEAGEAGLQSSLAGLAIHGKRSLVLDPEHSSMAMDVTYQLAQLAPDFIPMQIAGALTSILGGTVGTVIAPGAGTAAGVIAGYGAGMMGPPEAIRSLLIDHYEKGEHRDWNDFWTSLSAAAIAGGKSAAVGALTFGAGSVAGKVLGELGEKAIEKGAGKVAEKYVIPALQTAGTAAAEIATMVTAGSALDGHVPALKDFTHAGAAVGALHAFGIPSKLREVWKQTGLKPEQVADHAQAEPTVMQDVLSTNIEVPRAYEGAIDPNIKQQTEEARTEIPKDSEAVKPGPEFSEDFPEDKMSVSTDGDEHIDLTEPSATPAEEKTPTDLAREHFNERIGERSKDKPDLTFAEKKNLAKEFVKENWNSFYTTIFDQYDPIKRAMKEFAKNKDIKILFDAYKLFRMANDAPAKARAAFENGTFDFNTFKNNGKSLSDILGEAVGTEPMARAERQSRLNDFENFLAAQRALEYEKRGLKSRFDPEQARILIKADEARFGKAAQGIVDYQNKMLQYLKDSGRISRKTFQAMLEANQSYIPFKSIIEEGSEKAKSGKAGSLKKVVGVKNSETASNIVRPLEALAQNTQFFFEMAEINRAKRAFVNLAIESENKGDKAGVITKVPAQQVPIKMSADEVTRLLGEHGVDIQSEDGHTLFRPRRTELEANQFEVYRDGKREVYETTPELAKAINAVDAPGGVDNVAVRFALKVGTIAARSLRLGTSLSPDFIMRNFFRDQITAGAFSKAGMNPIDTFMALASMFKEDTAFKEMLKSGGAGGAFFELNDKYLKDNVYKLSKETGLLDRGINVVKSPLHLLKVLGEVAEQSTRLAEFKKTTQGDYSPAKLLEGGFNAREVTVDFQRIGANTATLNSLVPFFNASLQGVDRTARALIDNPKAVARRTLLGVTLPSVLNWFANHKYDEKRGFVADPRYAELKEWEKDLYWPIITDNWVKAGADDNAEYLQHLPDYMKRTDQFGRITEINKGHIYRIPKPQEIGLLGGTLVERMLELTLTDNPRAMKDFGGAVKQMLLPWPLPTIVQAPLEMAFNHNIFTDSPIIPQAAEKVSPEYRYTDYTSDTAKQLGEWIGTVPYIGKTNAASPAMIDHFVQSFTGNSGKNLLSILDASLRASGIITNNDKPELTSTDIPFWRAFEIRNPSFSSQSITDFREKFREVEMLKNDEQTLGKNYREADAAAAGKRRQEDITYEDLKGINQALSQAGKAAHDVNVDPSISRHDKRQLIDGWYYQAILAAKDGLQKIDDFNKTKAGNKP